MESWNKGCQKSVDLVSLQVGQLELSRTFHTTYPSTPLNSCLWTQRKWQNLGGSNLVRRMTLRGNSVDIWWLRFFKASKHENKESSGWCEPQILETIKTRVHGFTSTNTWWDASCCLYMSRRIVLSRVAWEWAEKQLNTYQNQLGVEVTRTLWRDSIL